MARMQTRTKRVSLEFLGDEWKDAYICFRRGHWRDFEVIEEINKTQKGTQALIATLEHMFHSGKMVDESGQLVEMTKDNVSEFDNDAILDLSEQMQEGADPKVPQSSNATSEEKTESPSDSSDSNTESASDSPSRK